MTAEFIVEVTIRSKQIMANNIMQSAVCTEQSNTAIGIIYLEYPIRLIILSYLIKHEKANE